MPPVRISQAEFQAPTLRVLATVPRASTWLALALALACLESSTAHGQGSPAGSYRAAPSELSVVITTWGEHCGPRPQARTDPTRAKVEVSAQGNELSLAFPDRRLRSDVCWSPNPLVKVASKSSAGGRWRLECKTAAGEAKRERGVYTITSAANAIELLEESEYDWQLKESHCVAKVRFTQRLQREGTQAPDLEAEAEQAPANCSPGPLARLRLRPSSAQIAPGERLCFTVRAFDAAGCPVPKALSSVTWNLSKRPAASGTLSGGCFKAAARAAEAEGRFQIAVTSGALRDESVVVVTTPDLSDITARRGGGSAQPSDESTDGGEAIDFGIQAAVKRSSLGVKLALVALLLALLSGAAAFVLRRRRGHEPTEHEPSDSERESAPAPTPVATSAAPSLSGEQLICPTCRRGYPAGTARCPSDGGVPIPYALFVQKAQASHADARTCRACGAQLSPGALFCGVCGSKLPS